MAACRRLVSRDCFLAPLAIDERRDPLGACPHLAGHRCSDKGFLYVVNREGELLDQVPADVPIFAYWDDRVYPRLNFPGRILLSQARDLARVIEREQIDLMYDRASQMTLTASLAMRRKSIPRISVAVGDPRRDFELLHSRFAFAKRHLLRRAYQSADRVVGVSEGVRQGLIDFFALPPAQVVTCPNLFDIDQIDEAANEAFDKYESDRFEIVSVGRLSPEKGYPQLQAKTRAARQHIVDNYSLKPGLRQLESLFDALIDADPRSHHNK